MSNPETLITPSKSSPAPDLPPPPPPLPDAANIPINLPQDDTAEPSSPNTATAKLRALKAQEKPRFKLTMADDMTCSLKSTYLVKGVLDKKSVSCIYGAPGGAKTFVAMDMALAISKGEQWHGRKTTQGAVLYIVLEGHRGFERRVQALKLTGKLPPGTPFATMLQPLRLFDPDHIEDLKQAIKNIETEKGFRFNLIVIDTLAHAMAGTDENATMDMMAAVEGMQELVSGTDTSIMIVHHSGKDTSKGSRGNSSLKGAVDSEFECNKAPDTEKGFILKTTKQKDMDGSASFPFRLKVVELGLDEDGDPVTSCVVECVDKHLTAAEAAKEAETMEHKQNMVRLLPQPSMTDWHKAAVEANALGENSTKDTARNFISRKMQKPDDYKTTAGSVGKAKPVARGEKWQFLELADNRTNNSAPEDSTA